MYHFDPADLTDTEITNLIVNLIKFMNQRAARKAGTNINIEPTSAINIRPPSTVAVDDVAAVVKDADGILTTPAALAKKSKAANSGRPWTPEDVGLVTTMTQAGHKTSAIAKTIGRTVGAVEFKLREIVLQMTLEGKSTSDIAKDLNLQESRTCNLLSAAGGANK